MPNQDAERARALVGCRFRPQGRDPETGLDCIGLVVAAFAVPVERVPRDYRLRDRSRAELERRLSEFFSRIAPARTSPGDVVLFEIAGRQLHLAVRSEGGFVHADAGIGRVVESRGEPRWPIIAAFSKCHSQVGEAA